MAITQINLNGIHQLDLNFDGTTTASITSPGVVEITNTGGGGAGFVELNPTANQIVTQPGSTAFEIKAGSSGASIFAVLPTAVEIATPEVIIQSPLQQYVAPLDGSGNPGEMIFSATASPTSGSLVQVFGSVAFFDGIALENYIVVTADTTIDFTFGASVALMDGSYGDVTLTLPNTLAVASSVLPSDAMEMAVIRNDTAPAGHTVTVAAIAPSTIQGLPSITLPNKTAVTLIRTTDALGAVVWQIQTDNRGSSISLTHDEPLTDGNANFIFAATLTTGGDIIVVTGIPN